MSDVLVGRELARCRRCGAITWTPAVGVSDWLTERPSTCAELDDDGEPCRGFLEVPFHESSEIGWYRYGWPHRHLADGRLLVLECLVTGYRLHVVATPWNMGSDEVYDFPDDQGDAQRAAFVALHLWNGEGEPEGWYRHRPSNRRRPGGDPEQEHVMR